MRRSPRSCRLAAVVHRTPDMSPGDLPVAGQWFAREMAAPGITRIWEPFISPLMQANVWHVRGSEADLIVDAGMGPGDLSLALDAWGLGGRPRLLVVTHCHSDHAGGAARFWPRAVHRAEARLLTAPRPWRPLLVSDYSPDYQVYFRLEAEAEDGSSEPATYVVTALPHAGFDPAAYTVTPAPPTLQLQGGDVIDLGDRSFEVLHLPGHSPGSVALWDEADGALFSGDVVYDTGLLLDELDGSSIPDYVDSLLRLRDLPVRVVYAGHGLPFGPQLLRRRIDDYVERRRASP